MSWQSFGMRLFTPPRCAGEAKTSKLITSRAMDAATISTWMTEIDSSVRAERDHLVQLDAAIGDGDHGINMARGFDAVVQALANDSGSSPGRLLIVAGRTLVS